MGNIAGKEGQENANQGIFPGLPKSHVALGKDVEEKGVNHVLWEEFPFFILDTGLKQASRA